MIPVKPIDPDDLPLYAMQLLTPAELEEMTSNLHYSPQARKLLAEIYGDLEVFAHGAEMHEPPAVAKQRLMKHVAREKKTVPAGPLDKYVIPIEAHQPRVAAPAMLLDDEPPAKSFGEKAMPWLGWAIAAGLTVFSVVEFQQSEQLHTTLAAAEADNKKMEVKDAAANELLQTMQDTASVHATLTLTSDAKPLPTGRVIYAADKGSLLFVANNMQPLPASKAYELWLIPSDGSAARPAGVFRPDQHGYASVILPQLPAGVDAKAFGITIEESEGSPIPTLPVIMKGAAS
jgi:hypothetical protein